MEAFLDSLGKGIQLLDGYAVPIAETGVFYTMQQIWKGPGLTLAYCCQPVQQE